MIILVACSFRAGSDVCSAIIRRGLVWASLLLVLTGCAGPSELQLPADDLVGDSPAQTSGKVVTRLQQQYREWRGVPYHLGGTSKAGIDCSAFVQRTFEERLNTRLPRTTAAQVRAGRAVARNDLQIGDLVFFRSANKVRHVGIYMGNATFLHASTSVGVTISRLDNVYWTRTYWQARRILDP